MTTRSAVPAALLILASTAAPIAAQDEFSWRGRLGDGQTLEIKGVNGGIRAVAARGSEARVVAEKTARRSDVDDVEIEVIEHRGGVTICAVYPSREGREPNECAPGDAGRMNVRNNDVKVEFIVEVPDGVHFTARTVNGGVDVEDIGSDVRAFTVNGSVQVTTSGFAEATTVNGSIDVAMNAARWSRDLAFETVNGRITLTLDGDVNADVEAETVNGGISSDYPLTIRGRFGPKRLSGTIGNGGPGIHLSTVNGSIALRRR